MIEEDAIRVPRPFAKRSEEPLKVLIFDENRRFLLIFNPDLKKKT